jgi:RNA polymerase sigma factor (sigma-70 family)
VDELHARGERLLREAGVPTDDAYDLLQDTWLVFLRKRTQIVEPRAWFESTLRKRALMYWRLRRKHLARTVDEALLDLMADDEAPPQEKRRLRLDLGRALGGVSTRCRRLLHMRYTRDLDARDVAELNGYRPSGIHKTLERCVSALARRLTTKGFREL